MIVNRRAGHGLLAPALLRLARLVKGSILPLHLFFGRYDLYPANGLKRSSHYNMVGQSEEEANGTSEKVGTPDASAFCGLQPLRWCGTLRRGGRRAHPREYSHWWKVSGTYPRRAMSMISMPDS